MLVTEGDSLRTHDALNRGIRRPHDAAEDPESESDDEDRSEDGHSRQRVRAAVKNLRHSVPRDWSAIISKARDDARSKASGVRRAASEISAHRSLLAARRDATG